VSFRDPARGGGGVSPLSGSGSGWPGLLGWPGWPLALAGLAAWLLGWPGPPSEDRSGTSITPDL